jgi:hypothetical protein
MRKGIFGDAAQFGPLPGQLSYDNTLALSMIDGISRIRLNRRSSSCRETTGRVFF